MVDLIVPSIGEVPVFEQTVPALNDWQNGVLVRTPNWLGDAVMAIPAIQQLKKIIPDFCGLFVLTPAPLAALFEALPFVDQVIPISDPHAFMTWKERKAVRKLYPGIGILFNNSLRDAISLKLCRIPKLYGANARFRKCLLERAFSFPPRKDFELNSPHQAAKYLSIVQALGVAAGAAYGSAKRWHTESFREVCIRKIAEGYRIVMLGGKAEIAAAEEILNGLEPEHCWNLAGKTGIHELIHVLKHSAVCLANDSGVMHLAAAVGAPGAAPFGPTDPVATSPVSANWRILFEKQSCSPCFKRVCPYGTKACFDSVTPEKVCEALQLVSRGKK